MQEMVTLKATVKNGRLVMDEPAPEYPDGTQLELVVVEPEEELDAEERAELNAVLAQSWREVQAGEGQPLEDLLEELKATR
ncbi:MAG: hypothetical protein JXR83_12600 [Deltaproteobacteria bacterium]|nr:hypothetical protein [Deltaproteobacteria bacterium]